MAKRKTAKKAKRQGTEHDFALTALRTVEQAIGEKMDGSPETDPLPATRTP